MVRALLTNAHTSGTELQDSHLVEYQMVVLELSHHQLEKPQKPFRQMTWCLSVQSENLLSTNAQRWNLIAISSTIRLRFANRLQVKPKMISQNVALTDTESVRKNCPDCPSKNKAKFWENKPYFWKIRPYFLTGSRGNCHGRNWWQTSVTCFLWCAMSPRMYIIHQETMACRDIQVQKHLATMCCVTCYGLTNSERRTGTKFTFSVLGLKHVLVLLCRRSVWKALIPSKEPGCYHLPAIDWQSLCSLEHRTVPMNAALDLHRRFEETNSTSRAGLPQWFLKYCFCRYKLSINLLRNVCVKRYVCVKWCFMAIYFQFYFFLGLLFFINSAFQTKSNSIHKEVLFFFPSFPALNDALSQSSSFKVTVTVYKQALALWCRQCNKRWSTLHYIT